MIFICQGCGLEADESKFNPAEDLSVRLSPGDIYTNLECPEEGCGALAMPAPQTFRLRNRNDGKDTRDVRGINAGDAACNALNEMDWDLSGPLDEGDTAQG
jgi:hypothetical protein